MCDVLFKHVDIIIDRRLVDTSIKENGWMSSEYRILSLDILGIVKSKQIFRIEVSFKLIVVIQTIRE